MMNFEHKKALFIVGASIFLFWVFRGNAMFGSKTNENRDKVATPKVNPKDLKGNMAAKVGFGALQAYIAAYNAGESQSVLDDLNKEFAKEMKVRVTQRKSDNKFLVTTLGGETILIS